MSMHREISFKGAISLILATFVILLIVSCATVYQGSLRKGSVIGAFDSSVYLDIESKEGVSEGQELNVYKSILYYREQPLMPAAKGAQTGVVKITEILNNHLAKAVVISGKAEKTDIVELAHPK